jgi:hypothetical protein
MTLRGSEERTPSPPTPLPRGERGEECRGWFPSTKGVESKSCSPRPLRERGRGVRGNPVTVTQSRSVTNATDFARPRSVVDRTRPCEGRRPCSSPGEDTFCRVEKQSTSEPDGKAAACKAALSGFDSHRRLLEGLLHWCRPSSGARASRLRDERNRGSAPCVPDMGSKRSSPISVSSAGRAPDLGLAVAGSTPVPSTKALGW